MHVWAHTRCCCMGMCKLRYAYRNSPRPRCSVLELAFSTADISIFTVVVPCVYVYVCVFALICRLTHWNHKSEVPKDSSQYGNDKKKGDLTIDTCSRVKGFETAFFTLN